MPGSFDDGTAPCQGWPFTVPGSRETGIMRSSSAFRFRRSSWKKFLNSDFVLARLRQCTAERRVFLVGAG